MDGDITYNGKKFDEFVVARSAGYIEQTDQHYAALTVRETFNFAASCQGAGYHSGRSKFSLAQALLHKVLIRGVLYLYDCMLCAGLLQSWQP